VVGWAAGNGTSTILGKAIVAMFICYACGRVLGAVAERAVQQDVERFKRENPLPKLGPPGPEPAEESKSSEGAT